MAIEFRTEVHPAQFPFELHLRDRILSLGSCFSENIAKKLKNMGLEVQCNPNGILFNPHSIAQCLHDILHNNRCSENDLVHQNRLWHSWKHHGKFSNSNKEDALKGMNKSFSDAHGKLDKTKLLIITFGSAWAYKHKAYGIVANCHKVPQKEFSKKLLSVSDIVSTWSPLLLALKNQLPGLEIIFTLSPVRHWKDGAEGNSLSKAILRTAIQELVNQQDQIHYFPANELLLDDLRDYRWFKDDMLHPSEQAVEYVWEKFMYSIFNKAQIKYFKEKEKLEKFKNHKTLHEESHMGEYEKRIKELQEKYTLIL